MKIAMIGSRGIPAKIGGVEKVVEDLARQLTNRGHEVAVYSRDYYVANSKPIEGIERIITKGISHKNLETLSYSFTAALDAIKRKDFDIIHIHSPAPAIWSKLLKKSNKPIVFTVHADDWNRKRWSLLGRSVLKFGLRAGMKNANAITAVSTDLAENLNSQFNKPVKAISNMLIPKGKPANAEFLKSHNLQSERYFLHVGRLVAEKRLDLLLRAWANIKTDLRLIIAGEFYDSNYREMCQSLASENVKFLGPIFGAELDQLYANSLAVAQPSDLEGASLVCLEAANFQKCIVCSDIAANKIQLGKGAIYFQASDLSKLQSAIEQVISVPDKAQKIGKRAYDIINSQYSPDSIIEKYLKVYAQVLQK